MLKRLLHVIPTLDQGGAEKQLVLLASRLPRDEFDVRVCALTRGGPLEDVLHDAGIPLTVIGKSWKLDPVAYHRLKQEVRSARADIVHTWLFAANSYGRQAALACKTPHLVAGERCADPWKVTYEFMIDRHLTRRTDAIVVPGGGVRDFYVRHGLPAEKFHVIPNGVAAASGDRQVSRENLLDGLKLPAGSRLVAAVGRLWRQKRVKDVIWAMELLSAVRKDVHLLIIGDGPERWRLERYCDRVHQDGQIHFLGHRDDVPSILPHLECLWLASSYEGMPNSILEAMSGGAPVIATDIPGNRDLVIPRETGYLVPVGDRAGFARHTLSLLEDPQLAHRLGDAARTRVREHFSVQTMVDRHAALYRQLAGD